MINSLYFSYQSYTIKASHLLIKNKNPGLEFQIVPLSAISHILYDKIAFIIKSDVRKVFGEFFIFICNGNGKEGVGFVKLLLL